MKKAILKAAYMSLQKSKLYFGLFHRAANNWRRRRLHPDSKLDIKKPSKEQKTIIRTSINALLEKDWEDAEAGVYPIQLIFDNDWINFFRWYRSVWMDAPLQWERMSNKENDSFGATIDTSGLPKYYLQNFHYQTDGYLSPESAKLYDIQVDLIFVGVADAMRRRIVAPLKSGLDPSHSKRVLDLACGTGRTLRILQRSIANTSWYGVDLSAAYLQKAESSLNYLQDEEWKLLQANGEELPFADKFFDAIVSVFLFHELPEQARQNVINECNRVLKSGGILVVCDSIQALDVPALKEIIENYPSSTHEPYYQNYSLDDVKSRLESSGFTNIENQIHFFSKYWIAYKNEENQ